jgi:hypothetical protein
MSADARGRRAILERLDRIMVELAELRAEVPASRLTPASMLVWRSTASTKRPHTDARSRVRARGHDGGVRQELAARVLSAPAPQ